MSSFLFDVFGVSVAPRAVPMRFHVIWTACWWARALSQLTLQASSNMEALSVQSLLCEFLEANRVALQESCRVGFEYDAMVWAEVAERIQRRDPKCSPQDLFMHASEDRRSKAKRVVLSSAAPKDEGRWSGPSSSSGAKSWNQSGYQKWPNQSSRR